MSENDRSLATICWITTAILATFLALLQLAVMISLMASRTGFRVAAPLTLAASLLFGYLLAHHELLSARTRWTPIAITLSLLAVSIALSAFFYDLSWDGEWYQQTGIIRIASDWNPLTDPMREFTKHLQLWVRHYAKGPWYIAAAIYQTTGRIELGKFVPWIALAATFLATLAASLDAGLRRKPAIATAALIAINPVVTSELPTYLVDGIMFGFLIVAVAATISALRQPRTSVIVTGIAASIVAINAKFTGLVFLCFALAAIGLWCLFKKREQLLRFTAISIGTLALGACIWGYNPYITNTIHRHQPFYPVLGSANFPSLAQQGRDGIDRYETPKNIMGRNRFLRFGERLGIRPVSAGVDHPWI